MKDTIDLLNKYLCDKDTVIVGTSGGPDSMCLISLCLKVRNLKIICACVDHNVRKESKEEYNYVKSFCNENNIIFEGMTIDNYSSDNFEAEARKKRYKFFQELAKKYNAKYILTAHHGDDLIETILMRIARGSNLSGYAGIKMLDGKYFRPLLNLTKEDILNYLNENNIKYYIDCTNTSIDHTRNRYRMEVLPFLKKENNNIHEKYLKFSNELCEYDKFVNEYITSLKDIYIDDKINVDNLLKENEFIQRKLVENYIKNIQKEFEFPVDDITFDNIMNLINSKKSNNMINLSCNFIARKEYNIFSITKNIVNESYEIVFLDSFKKENFYIKKVDSSFEKSNWVLRISKDEVTLPFIIRSRKIGDAMECKNTGSKKIKDIFIDSKVSLTKRDTWPIVCDSVGKILWVPGLKKSKFDKEKNEKYDIILLCEREER